MKNMIQEPRIGGEGIPHPSTNYFRMWNKNERDEREGFPVDQPSSPIIIFPFGHLFLSPNLSSSLQPNLEIPKVAVCRLGK